MKTILVTGASSDIGIEYLKMLPADSTRIIATFFRGNIPDSGSPRVTWEGIDFSDLDAVRSFGQKLASERIDYYVQLNGDVRLDDSLLDWAPERYSYLTNVNFLSTVVLLESLLPGMMEREFGRIVLMSTASARHGGGERSFVYGLAKHSVDYLVKHLARHYSRYNLLANCVSPGLIRTRFHTERLEKDADAMADRARTVRVGRAGRPTDVARIIYTLTLDNDFVTGQNIKIDGADFI